MKQPASGWPKPINNVEWFCWQMGSDQSRKRVNATDTDRSYQASGRPNTRWIWATLHGSCRALLSQLPLRILFRIYASPAAREQGEDLVAALLPETASSLVFDSQISAAGKICGSKVRGLIGHKVPAQQLICCSMSCAPTKAPIAARLSML